MSGAILPAAARPRRYGFPLTPLADAMFQLLVFFMLSSSLAPYSLIPLTGGAASGRSSIDGEARADAPPPQENAPVLIWHLSRGQLRAGTQVLPLSDIRSLVPALREAGDVGVLLFPAASATVQDLARVTEVLALAGIDRVQIIAGSRAAGG
ncbi:MAG: biopolymer transporter ExbD [Paracoccaceae bacterium]|nr:MAG: biopolymer transporter ExbD [Paracoccaceae bacterium]